MMVWLRNRSDKILLYYPFYCATLKNRYFIDEIFRERRSQELVLGTGIYHTADKSDVQVIHTHALVADGLVPCPQSHTQTCSVADARASPTIR